MPDLARRRAECLFGAVSAVTQRTGIADTDSKEAQRAREGNRGTTLHPGRPAHTPHTGTSGKPLPGLPPPYGPALGQMPSRLTRTEPAPCLRIRRPAPRNPAHPLDTDSKEDSLWTVVPSGRGRAAGAQIRVVLARRDFRSLPQPTVVRGRRPDDTANQHLRFLRAEAIRRARSDHMRRHPNIGMKRLTHAARDLPR